MTKAVDPREHALWTLPDLYTYLVEYLYVVYDQNEHSSLGMSPQAAYLWGGEREHIRMAYNNRFLKETCPTTAKGTAVVQKGSGIKVNHFYYWNNAFRSGEVVKTSVPIRFDPFDISTVYAQVQGQWLTCRSSYITLEGHTERELFIATQELRQSARRDGETLPVKKTRSRKKVEALGSTNTSQESASQAEEVVEPAKAKSGRGRRKKSTEESALEGEARPSAPSTVESESSAKQVDAKALQARRGTKA